MASPRRRRLTRWDLLRRIDAAARDLNIVLLVMAIGLAVLDGTFAVSQRVLGRLPIPRVICDVRPLPTD
jgi:hypothetical protein